MFFISAAVLSEPIMAAAMPRLFKPATWSFINDMRGATTRQTEDISVCFSAFSTPTAIPSKTNGAISKHNDLPDPAGEQKNTSFPRHVSDRLVTYRNLISAGQSLKPLPCLPDRLPCFEETKTTMASFSSLRLLRDKNPSLCYWSIAMTSPVEFSTGEFGAKQV